MDVDEIRGSAALSADFAGLAAPPAPAAAGAGRVVTVLPPREGFSPGSVGAIGLLVHRLGQPEDVVIGRAGGALTFSGRRFVPALPPLWPMMGRVERYMAGVARTVRRLNPAVIEVHNRANLALRLARAQPAARVVLFVHNDPQGMRRARLPADRALLLASLQVVCVSGYLRDRFMEGVPPGLGAPLLLHNALDFEDLPPRLDPEARERTILFVGRVVANKGADTFVEACAACLPQLADWRAVMIGADRFTVNGPKTAFERALQPRAQAAGIEMRGYEPHGRVMEAMARAAIVVVPSRWAEPFGLTALEAMASGAALICGPRGGLPEVAGDAALYADPDRPGAVAEALLRLAGDAGLRAEMAARGLARARLFDAAEARLRLAELRGRLLGP